MHAFARLPHNRSAKRSTEEKTGVILAVGMLCGQFRERGLWAAFFLAHGSE
jgi:hypothetical protein